MSKAKSYLFWFSMLACGVGVILSVVLDQHIGWVIYFSVCLAAGFINIVTSTITGEENRCKVRIVHASTHRRGEKGTGYIIEAVDRLRGEGHQVELEIVQNVPHSKVRSVYENADIAVDQLLTGWYGGFAVEMMALGKPVVSYIRNEDLGVVPKRMRMDMPIIRAEPDTIYNVLASTIRNESARQMQGRRGREYVERWHDPIKIATRMKETYESIS